MNRRIVLQAAVLVATITATGALLASGGEEREHKGRLPQQVNAKWSSECGSCHLAYPPGFLAEPAWRKLMADLDNHFGDNASLDPATAKEITEFLAANARQSKKPGDATDPVLRISESRWFVRKHDEVPPDAWKRKAVGGAANCKACHRTADKGSYSERHISIPQ